MIDEHRAEIDLCGLEPDDVTRLLTHCLENNVFEFDNEFYRQRVGIAMGNKVAPPVAIIFMHKFETRALDNAVLKPEFYSRYIDDSIGVWTHGQDELNKFLEYLNSIHPRIKFTLEDSNCRQMQRHVLAPARRYSSYSKKTATGNSWCGGCNERLPEQRHIRRQMESTGTTKSSKYSS
ncbi:uncharacterized protein LOC122387330 [Amphibalanus amphitrite]|uniref:uncharacterized protein LOC122387330 n=1 Tax=Amphibalanus amphitrite TaxID=1232801 RepID=UPI001C907A88|nr:uncharacterized protein LOC122387330 [Amphibalanus amphitrite]